MGEYIYRKGQRTILSRGKWKQGFRKVHWWPFSKELSTVVISKPQTMLPLSFKLRLLLHHFKETAPQASITSELWNLTLDPSPPLTSKPAPLHANTAILPCDRVKHLSFSQFPSRGGPIFHNTARISHCSSPPPPVDQPVSSRPGRCHSPSWSPCLLSLFSTPGLFSVVRMVLLTPKLGYVTLWSQPHFTQHESKCSCHGPIWSDISPCHSGLHDASWT